jgi:hypothetical protein
VRGPKLDLKARILDRVATGAPHGVWTPVDFLDLGARAAVDKALQRLANDGVLRRVDRGLYDKPSTNSLTGKPTPPLVRAVVDAVARRDNARLLVDGMTAANDLGLTTAVPSQVTVLTDARLKPIQLGAQTIRFKQAAPSRLYWAGHPAMRIVQALYWLKDVLPTDPDVRRRLIDHLKQGQRSDPLIFDLWRGFSAMPTWMQTVVRELFIDAGVDTLLTGPPPQFGPPEASPDYVGGA